MCHGPRTASEACDCDRRQRRCPQRRYGAVQFARLGITVNCIHRGTTRTEPTPRPVTARAAELGVSQEEAERRDYARHSPGGNAICRMLDASEIAFVAALLASEKAWPVTKS